ncbi:MAG TPA: hypothetical protein VMY78_14355 [Solirubrobacteraceae bacterium]|nr:hypothetical protein [Solirubrobacteraceae bacterium]
MFLLSWVLYPLVLAALCLGCGLLVDRLERRTIAPALLLPAGFALVVVLATVLTFLDETSELAAPAIVVAALAGYVLAVLARPAALRPSARWVWPAVAMAIAFGALAAPVVLTGKPGLTGIVRIVDLASQIDLADFILEHGRSLEGVERDSSYHLVADQLLQGGYPVGAQAALGATARVAGLDVIWAWQPFMAWMGAMLALALYALLGRAIAARAARAVAAGVAAQPTILYSYALVSGVKELAGAVFVALTAALLAGASPRALPVGLAIAAGLCAVNVGIAPWAVVLVAAALGPGLVASVRGRGRPRIAGRSWVLAAVAIALVALPTAGAAIKLEPLLRSGGPVDLGNLTAPVPPWAAVGPWLTSDHRYPLELADTETLTALLAAFVALLALTGLVRAVWRRDRGLYGAAAAAAVAVVVVVARGSSWVELKAFAISAPLAAALAFAGAAAIGSRGWRRWPALLAGAGVAAAILAGNVMVYRNVPLAPYDRFAELEELGERYAGTGPMLHSSFDEYAAYFLRDADLITPLDVSPDDLPRPSENAVTASFAPNLDAFRLRYVQGFDHLLVRRGDPTQSRPPSDWRLAQRTTYYDVYRHDRSAPEVVSHHPSPRVRPAALCRTLRTQAARASDGARIAYAAPADGVALEYPPEGLPLNWLSDRDERLARGPGRLRTEGALARGGEFDVWIRGSFGRRVTVSVDGRPLGAVRWQESYPLSYEPLGRATLAAGTHRFEVLRGGGSVLPGSGNELGPEGIITRIGPISLIRRDARPPVRIVSPRSGIDVCRSDRRLDWMEVVRPR